MKYQRQLFYFISIKAIPPGCVDNNIFVVSELDKPWRGKNDADPNTIITISILSTIIVLIILSIIATVMVKRRKAALENARFDWI